MKTILYSLFAGLLLWSCQAGPDAADQVFINGIVYTVDEANPKVEAVAVKDGLILAVGTRW